MISFDSLKLIEDGPYPPCPKGHDPYASHTFRGPSSYEQCRYIGTNIII